MKIKHILTGCAVAASFTAFTSCSDFLTEEPQGKVAPETFYKTADDLTLATNALLFLLQDYQCNTNSYIIDQQGDDITAQTTGNKQAYRSADQFEYPSDMKGVLRTWNCMYKIIKACNDLINYSDNCNASQSAIDIAKGQGYYWRAFAYFNLVRYYGKVILNLDNVPDDNKAPLSEISDIYAQIVSDLEAADKLNLPAKYTNEPQALAGANVFVSAQAVKATLAAVHMHMAGYPLNQTSHYADAARYAKQVIDGVNGGTYDQSVQDWDQVYNYGNNYNNGIMLGIFYRAVSGGWSSSDSQNSSSHWPEALGGWGDFIGERRFWAEFPDGPRKDNLYSKQIYLRADENGNAVLADWWATTDQQPYNEENGCVPTYHPLFIAFAVNNDGGPSASPYDYTKPFWKGMCINKTHQLIRYAEVLCWYAEAVGRGGSADVAGAQAALRQVREKAYPAGSAAIAECSTLTGDALAEAAYREHGWEVGGMPQAMVTRRSDQFRMDRLKEAWEYRHGKQTAVLVPKGTLTHAVDAEGNPFTYELSYDVVLDEPLPVNATWDGEKSIYAPYPPEEAMKNPNLVR